jgi:superfamily I DNA/RNA helicase
VLNGLNATELNGDDSSLKGYHSLLKGVDPIVENFSTLEEEETFLVEKIKMLLDTYQPESICLLARKKDLLEVYKEYLEKNGILCRVLDKDDSEQNDGRIRLATMHRVKGLEFTCVFILSANEGIIPRSSVIKGREKALLFVAATRARDLLFVTSYGEPSRFLRN